LSSPSQTFIYKQLPSLDQQGGLPDEAVALEARNSDAGAALIAMPSCRKYKLGGGKIYTPEDPLGHFHGSGDEEVD